MAEEVENAIKENAQGPESPNAKVRRMLRNRARYEVANNSYACGIVLSLANDVIGIGPRLQMLLGEGQVAGANRTVESEFSRWAKAVGLPGMGRTYFRRISLPALEEA